MLMPSSTTPTPNEVFLAALGRLFFEAECSPGFVDGALIQGKVHFEEIGLEINKEMTLREIAAACYLADMLPPLDPDGSGRLLRPRKEPAEWPGGVAADGAADGAAAGGEYEDPFGVKLCELNPKYEKLRTLKHAVDQIPHPECRRMILEVLVCALAVLYEPDRDAYEVAYLSACKRFREALLEAHHDDAAEEDDDDDDDDMPSLVLATDVEADAMDEDDAAAAV